MVNSTDIFNLLERVYKLKLSVDTKPYTKEQKNLIQKHLNEVLDYLQEVKIQC
jgi:hypothetical protein